MSGMKRAMEYRTHTISDEAMAHCKREVTERYRDVEPRLQESLKKLRVGLHAWAGNNDEAHALVNAILRQVDAAFGAHWPDTADKDNTVLPELRAETAVSTMIEARSPFMGFKRQMYNPQLVAHAYVMRTAQKLHAKSGLPPMIGDSDAIIEVVREAVKPLMRMPQHHDHEMHL